MVGQLKMRYWRKSNPPKQIWMDLISTNSHIQTPRPLNLLNPNPTADEGEILVDTEPAIIEKGTVPYNPRVQSPKVRPMNRVCDFWAVEGATLEESELSNECLQVQTTLILSFSAPHSPVRDGRAVKMRLWRKPNLFLQKWVWLLPMLKFNTRHSPGEGGGGKVEKWVVVFVIYLVDRSQVRIL